GWCAAQSPWVFHEYRGKRAEAGREPVLRGRAYEFLLRVAGLHGGRRGVRLACGGRGPAGRLDNARRAKRRPPNALIREVVPERPMAVRLFLRLIVLSLLVLLGTACGQPAHKETSGVARFTFPPEWASHDAVWLGWSYDSAHHTLQVEIARALAPTVPVRILVTSAGAREQAKAALAAAGIPSDRVGFFSHPVPNTWIRDAGPRFLSDGRNLAVADFAWNWYGYPEEMSRQWPTPAPIDNDLARELGLPVVSSAIVAEGGALDVSTSV